MRREVKIIKVSHLTAAEKSDLLQVGQRMANVLYNMKTDKQVPESWREWAKILQTKWDAIRHREV